MRVLCKYLLLPILAAGTAWGETSNRTSVTDHGIVANTSSAATANQAALRKLISPSASGGVGTFTGKVIFPNTSGHHIYFFDPLYVEVRDDISIDCQGATLDFTGSYDADNDTKGFLTFIRNVSVENCNIKVDYDGTAGLNNGSALRLGARAARYGFGANQTKFEEEDLTKPMGNILVRNIHITTNNPDAPAILALGGLQNTVIDTVTIDGNNLAPAGIYYEFGQWHYEGGVAGDANISTHAINFRLKNWRVSNVTKGAVSFTGIMTATVDGLWVDRAANVFVARLGEAGYYNMTGTPTERMKAHIDLHNINGKNIASTGIAMLGSESLLNGYLARDIKALGAKDRVRAQTDKITFNLDGFYLADSGIVVNAPYVRIANGTQKDGGKRGIWLQSEAAHFEIDNVKVLDNDGIGIASDAGGLIHAVARFRKGSISNCFIAGNGADGGHDAGIALSQVDGVLIDSCRFGYELEHDGVAETTQGRGVTKQATTRNLTIRNSYGGGTSTSEGLTQRH